MLKALTILLGFQGLGEVLRLWVFPSIPAPVIGLLGMLLFLFIKGEVPTEVQRLADGFTSNLGILFVPAAVGIMVLWPIIESQAWVILLALAVSVVLTLAVTAWVLDWAVSRFLPNLDAERASEGDAP